MKNDHWPLWELCLNGGTGAVAKYWLLRQYCAQWWAALWSQFNRYLGKKNYGNLVNSLARSSSKCNRNFNRVLRTSTNNSAYKYTFVPDYYYMKNSGKTQLVRISNISPVCFSLIRKTACFFRKTCWYSVTVLQPETGCLPCSLNSWVLTVLRRSCLRWPCPNGIRSQFASACDVVFQQNQVWTWSNCQISDKLLARLHDLECSFLSWRFRAFFKLSMHLSSLSTSRPFLTKWQNQWLFFTFFIKASGTILNYFTAQLDRLPADLSCAYRRQIASKAPSKGLSWMSGLIAGCHLYNRKRNNWYAAMSSCRTHVHVSVNLIKG